MLLDTRQLVQTEHGGQSAFPSLSASTWLNFIELRTYSFGMRAQQCILLQAILEVSPVRGRVAIHQRLEAGQATAVVLLRYHTS